jgi:hypothetical protein
MNIRELEDANQQIVSRHHELCKACHYVTTYVVVPLLPVFLLLCVVPLLPFLLKKSLYVLEVLQ